MKKASLSASSVALKGSSDTELALKQSRLFLDYNAGALDSGNLGNPNGLHEESRQAASVLSHARARVARLVGASPGEIFFFPSASLANYFLITSFARVCCSPYEHPSVYKSISEFDSENPTLVSAMLANNETGEIYNIEHIFSQFPNAKKHSDISQAVGKIPVDLGSAAGALAPDGEAVRLPGGTPANPTDLNFNLPNKVSPLGATPDALASARAASPLASVDFATISSQKIGGGKGAAALYIRGGAPALKAVTALKYRLFALGTPNTQAIASFGAAAEQAAKTVQKFQKHIKPLRDQLRARIEAEIPNVIINTPTDPEHSLPNTLDVSFPGAEGESIMLMLDAAGIATSTGSACATADGKPSHVLMAMYTPSARVPNRSGTKGCSAREIGAPRKSMSMEQAAELAHGSIRFSFPPDAPADTPARVMAVLPGIIKKLRSIS